MNKFLYIGEIKEGKLPDEINRQVRDYLKMHRGEMIEVIIKHHSPSITLKQKKLYWNYYCEPIAKFIGKSIKEIDLFLCKEFLPPRNYIFDGKIRQEIQDVDDLNNREFSDFLMQIDSWCIENKITLP